MGYILISGGSGMVGSALKAYFNAKGKEVRILSRKPKNNDFYWNPKQNEIDSEAVKGADYIINLAGAGVADHRWTESYKKELNDSRIQSTRLLVNEANKYKSSLKKFISASAIGYYAEKTGVLDESSEAGNDFLGNLCKAWENETQSLEMDSLAIIRIGIVLSSKGGFLQKLSLPAKLGVLSPIGSGKQVISWIHIQDLCRLIDFIIEKDLNGKYNATSPNPVNNSLMLKSISKAFHRPFILPAIPAFVIKLLFGEMSVELLSGKTIIPQNLINQGFQFEFPEIELALNDLVK